MNRGRVRLSSSSTSLSSALKVIIFFRQVDGPKEGTGGGILLGGKKRFDRLGVYTKVHR